MTLVKLPYYFKSKEYCFINIKHCDIFFQMLLVEGEQQIHNLLQVKNNIEPVFNDFMTIVFCHGIILNVYLVFIIVLDQLYLKLIMPYSKL